MKRIHFKSSRGGPRNAPAARDPNSWFTVAVCAGWGARVMAVRQEIEEAPLTFAFWLSGIAPRGQEELLEVFFSETDRKRLLPEIKKALGKPEDLASLVRLNVGDAPAGRIRRMAQEMASLLEDWSRIRDDHAHCGLARQLHDTGALFGLTDQEVEFCFFLTVMKGWGPVQDYFEHYLSCDEIRGRRSLLVALGISQGDLARILGGKLSSIGIIDIGSSYLSVEDEFQPFFMDPYLAPSRQELFRELPAPGLTSDRLGLPEKKVAFLRSLLTSPGEQPVHVLLYGPPGTGKTTLARALCAELDLRGIEVLGQKENRAGSRRAALAACMEMVSGRSDSVLVVDEADLVLNTDRPWFQSGETMDKGYLNGVLERPGVRGVWIVNRRDDIDPAVRRRFAYSLELPPLGVDKRAEMLEATLRRCRIKRHFPRALIRELAEEFELTPALFAQAARVAARVQASPAGCRAAVREVLDAQVGLQGKKRADTPTRVRDAVPFMECGVNPDRPLADIIGPVQRFDDLWRAARPGRSCGPLALLFHGLPGTGKTATAAHLAARIDRKVVTKRASDLLDPYVGMTERNLAAAFDEASGKGAVLILDEVDTFLSSRAMRRRSWEISMVNELLVQIEQHQGLVICTTNRMESLDEAALRRFALKVEFRPLTPGQAEEVYGLVLGPLGRGSLSPVERERLRSLSPLTTADMVLVRRNRRFLQRGRVAHAVLLGDLAREVAVKPQVRGKGRRMGFA